MFTVKKLVRPGLKTAAVLRLFKTGDLNFKILMNGDLNFKTLMTLITPEESKAGFDLKKFRLSFDIQKDPDCDTVRTIDIL